MFYYIRRRYKSPKRKYFKNRHVLRLILKAVGLMIRALHLLG